MLLPCPLHLPPPEADHVHHPADEEEGKPNEEGVPPTGQGHDEGRGRAEPGDAQGDAKDHGPDDEALGDLVGLADVVDVAGEGSSSDVRVATLDEGDAVSGDELVGDEGDATTGGEEEHETGIVLRSGESGQVEEANDLGRLGHAAEGQAKGKDGGGTNGGEDLEDVRNVRGYLFLLECAAVVVVVVGELQFLLLLFVVGGRYLSLNVLILVILFGGRRGLLFLMIIVGRVRGSRYRPNLYLAVVGIILSLLGQLPFSDDIGDIDDGGHAEQGRKEDAKSGSNLGLIQDPLLQTGGLVDAWKGRTAKAGGEEGHAHEGAYGDDGSGTHPSDAADAVAGRAAVGALGAEAGEEAADGHDPEGGVGEGVEDAPVGGVEVGQIDQELDGEEEAGHEGAFPTLLRRTDGIEGMGSEGSH